MDESIETEETTAKKKGRPVGTGTSAAINRILRVPLTPRMDRLLEIIRSDWGMSNAETARRALDSWLDEQIRRGDLVDPGPGTTILPTSDTEDSKKAE